MLGSGADSICVDGEAIVPLDSAEKYVYYIIVYIRGVKLIFAQGPHEAQFDLKWAEERKKMKVRRKEKK